MQHSLLAATSKVTSRSSWFEANALNSCDIVYFIEGYTSTLVFCYDLAVSIELTYKVVKPSRKGYFIPLKVYHLLCNLSSLSLAVIQTVLGDPYWDKQSGCDNSTAQANM
jgi:hypothetical protein